MNFSRLSLTLILLFLGCYLPAQTNWQVSGGLEIQKGRNTYTNKAQPITAYNTVVNLERIIDFPKSRATIILHLGWQYLRANGSNILYAEMVGVTENLEQENFLVGPGLQLSLWKKRKYHPLIGLQLYFGTTMGSAYRLDNDNSDSTVDLPVAFVANGGVNGQVGINTFVGVERNLSERSYLRLKLGTGQHSQFRSWEAKDINNRVLLKGGLWMSSVEMAYRL